MLTLKQITSMLTRMGLQFIRVSSFIITMFTLKHITSMFTRMPFQVTRTSSCKITMLTLKHITSMFTRMGFQVIRISGCIIAMLTLKEFPKKFRQTDLLGRRLIHSEGRTLTFRCFLDVIKLMKFQIRIPSSFRISIVSQLISDICTCEYKLYNSKINKFNNLFQHILS